MTAVREAAASGTGRILANFREILAPSRAVVEKRIEELKAAGINAVYLLGNTSEPICQIDVGMNRVGMVLLGGLNPVAAAAEAGYEVENAAESGLIEYGRLVDIDHI
jgi:repressor of nif and glnA expression